MTPNLKLLSALYRMGLFLQKIYAALAWFFGGLWKIVRYLVCDIYLPNWKQFTFVITAFCAFMAFMLFVVQPVQEWIEDRAMMRNPIIAHVGDDLLIDGKKVIRFNEEGRFHMHEVLSGGIAIDFLRPIDQPDTVIVCVNSAFQNMCPRLVVGQSIEIVDYDGLLGTATYVMDKKSGDTYVLIKLSRALQTLPPEYRE